MGKKYWTQSTREAEGKAREGRAKEKTKAREENKDVYSQKEEMLRGKQ